MEWIAQNWLWILFGIFFIGIHMFGHGGHGGGHEDHNPSGRADTDESGSGKDSQKKRSGHQH